MLLQKKNNIWVTYSDLVASIAFFRPLRFANAT